MSKHGSTFQPCTQHPAPSNSSSCSHHLDASPTLHLTSAASYLLALLTPLPPPSPHLPHSGPLTQSLLLGSLIPRPWCDCLEEYLQSQHKPLSGPQERGLGCGGREQSQGASGFTWLRTCRTG